jgi:hypothetical protein
MSETIEPAAPEGVAAPPPAQDEAPQPGTEQENQAAKPEGEGEQKDQPKRKPWFQERIDDLVREKWDERRRAEAAEAELATIRQGQSLQQPAQDGQKLPLTAADIDRLANERAAHIAAEQRFNADCNKVYNEGKAAHADFDEAVQGLSMLAPRREFFEAVTELPDAANVYYHLGKNLDEAARILRLPPVKMAVELAKLSSGAKPKPVSRAPAPIQPVNGAARGEPDPDKMSIGDWVKWREKQIRESRA